MAASATRNSLRTHPLLIDLTVSDEEDGPQFRRRIHRKRTSPISTARMLWEPLVSNHGLLLPGIFDQEESLPQHRRIIPEPNHAERHQVSKSVQSSVHKDSGRPSPPPSKRDGILRTNTNPVPSQRSAGKPLGRTQTQDQNPSFNSLPDAVKGPKRRKTFHNGTISRDPPISATPTSAPTPLERRIQLLMAAKPVKSSLPSVNIPVANNLVGWPSRLQHGNARSRVSGEGRIQKAKHSSHRDVQLLAEERNERIVQVLRNQVFKHIKTAIRRHHGSLTNTDRTAIGTKTAGKLVEDASFAKNLTSNDWRLSLDYERSLSLRAQGYVDKYAKTILNRVGGVPRETYKRTPQNELVNSEMIMPVVHSAEVHANGAETSFHSSSTSEDGDQIFEKERQLNIGRLNPSHNPTPRRYSSSPTTSFSNDFANGTAQLDEEETEYSIAAVKVSHTWDHIIQPRRSGRAKCLAAQRSRPTALKEPSHIKSPSTLMKDDAESRILSHDNVREVQGLVAAGLDRDFSRPYTRLTIREDTKRGCKIIPTHRSYQGLAEAEDGILLESILHLDFCLEEIELICELIMRILNGKHLAKADPREQVISLMADGESNILRIVNLLEEEIKKPGPEPGRSLLRSRGPSAITAFLEDAANNTVSMNPQLVRLQKRSPRKAANPKPTISLLLRQRETWGMAPFMVGRGQNSFETTISSYLEDSLVRQGEWMDCCGDIAAVSWTSENAFICGTTAHSDYHNMQYNKPGNLAVGSSSLDTLKAVADHRIKRPVIAMAENAVNALDSMRQTQDPWLYTSVVSTSHSEITGCTFTASFDKTVKVWAVSGDGSSMSLLGTWDHDGKVNFVVTSEHHERVATASDVSNDAVRVYNFDKGNISGTPFDTYNGEKAKEQALELRRRDSWAYFPATIQWGRAECVKDLLLVGYSPRSVTGNETDIPDDKKNSGELCVWNACERSRVPISSARTQNVFEVMWHPSQPIFLAATSPCGIFEPETRTQVRLFGLTEVGAFVIVKALDCPASDINELTIMPNSNAQCYVTASCTDGNTYVWDTVQGDKAIHVLSHGDSLDNPTHDLPREVADTGVKFASWGHTSDRFYTGASDGRVKAWDIRAAQGNAFVRNILEVSGGISAGAFSKNFSRLLIGDATGKVHLLGIDDSDLEEGNFTGLSTSSTSSLRGLGNVESLSRSMKRPKTIVPHPEPPAPEGPEMKVEEIELTGPDIARVFLEEGQLALHPDRKIGAIQGPNYHETQLYRSEAHEYQDETEALLPEWQARQQCELRKHDEDLRISLLPKAKCSVPTLHPKNVALDFDLSRLSLETQGELRRDRIEFDWDEDHMFEHEMLPSLKIFKDKGRL